MRTYTRQPLTTLLPFFGQDDGLPPNPLAKWKVVWVGEAESIRGLVLLTDASSLLSWGVSALLRRACPDVVSEESGSATRGVVTESRRHVEDRESIGAVLSEEGAGVSSKPSLLVSRQVNFGLDVKIRKALIMRIVIDGRAVYNVGNVEFIGHQGKYLDFHFSLQTEQLFSKLLVGSRSIHPARTLLGMIEKETLPQQRQRAFSLLCSCR